MKAAALLLLLLLATHAFSQRERSYPQTAFDSDTCCWRKLSKAGQHHEAAQLIADYIDNSPNAANKHSLNWHAGQAYAMAAENRKATKHIKRTYNLFYRWFGGEDGRAWYFYARGTVAFIKQDRGQFDRMLRLWGKELQGKDINYDMLLRLRNHWGERYSDE